MSCGGQSLSAALLFARTNQRNKKDVLHCAFLVT